ncbi:hypothetical protein SDC9_55954 [bioreactor metagenome]|uniref:Uncharacterized protein n=1 Tax=bioreactor metagenome TaxID=1076179 RepID=A0A644X5P8_9ZZZZ
MAACPLDHVGIIFPAAAGKHAVLVSVAKEQVDRLRIAQMKVFGNEVLRNLLHKVVYAPVLAIEENNDLLVCLHDHRAILRQPGIALFKKRSDQVIADMAISRILCACAKNQRFIARDVAVFKERVIEHRVAVRAARDQRKTLLFTKARKLTLNLNRSVAAVERRAVLIDIIKVHVAFPFSAKRIGMRFGLRPEIQQIPVWIRGRNLGL